MRVVISAYHGFRSELWGSFDFMVKKAFECGRSEEFHLWGKENGMVPLCRWLKNDYDHGNTFGWYAFVIEGL